MQSEARYSLSTPLLQAFTFYKKEEEKGKKRRKKGKTMVQ